VSTLNSARAGFTDTGWADLLTCLAFQVDRSTEGEEPTFAIVDGAGAVEVRAWIEGRPQGTSAYLASSSLQRTTALPAHVEAGFRGGGLHASTVVREPQRVYTLDLNVSTRPEYRTSGRVLFDYIAQSPYRLPYEHAFQEVWRLSAAPEDLQRHLEHLAPGDAVSDAVRQFRTIAKIVEGTGKDWSRFLGAIPYADRTRVAFEVVPVEAPPAPELDLGAARSALQAAIQAALQMIRDEPSMDGFARHFESVLHSFDKPAVIPLRAERHSRRARGTQTAPTVQAILQGQGLSDEAQQVIGAARNVEAVFGGMGSWNDTPYTDSRETAALYAAAHAAYRTAVNQTAWEA
jgi:hypothetical protein